MANVCQVVTLGLTVKLLTQSLGVHGPRSNGLGELAGTWSEEEHRDFEQIARVGSVTLSR